MKKTVVTRVRLGRSEFEGLTALAERLHLKRSAVIRRALDPGVRRLLLDESVAAYETGRASAWKAARSAGTPLSQFLDELQQRGVPFRTDEALLKKQVRALLRAKRCR